MSEHYLPVFVNDALCKHYDPEWWFPEYGSRKTKQRTKEDLLARTICAECPARQECKEYAMQYSGLFGIWAGMNDYERELEQKRLGIVPTAMNDTLSIFNVLNTPKEFLDDKQ